MASRHLCKLKVQLPRMKTLIITLAALTLSFTSLTAKDGAFTSVIIPDGGKAIQFDLAARQWIKITNFTQNGAVNAMPAGVAVFKGENGLWVLFATEPGAHAPHEDVFVAGPATVLVSPPEGGHAAVFLTYQRGSD